MRDDVGVAKHMNAAQQAYNLFWADYSSYLAACQAGEFEKANALLFVVTTRLETSMDEFMVGCRILDAMKKEAR